MSDIRSFSQWSQYSQCAYAYQLARLDKAWQRPAAWFPMGTAVHAGAEAYERSGRTLTDPELVDVFTTSYWSEIDEYLEVCPNTDYWFASGPYKGPEDIQRRFLLGQEHVIRYKAWYDKHPEEKVWVLPDGRPGIEIPFLIDLGGIPVRGVIDFITWIQGKWLGPRDNKSGNRAGELRQIKLYGQVLEDYYAHIGQPVEVKYGDFFKTKTGKPTVKYDLTTLTRDDLVVDYQTLDAGVRAGDFPPNPSADNCWSCTVRDSCSYKAV